MLTNQGNLNTRMCFVVGGNHAHCVIKVDNAYSTPSNCFENLKKIGARSYDFCVLFTAIVLNKDLIYVSVK